MLTRINRFGINAIVLMFVTIIPGTLLRAETFSGQAQVIDGDTVVIAGNRIRLDGIDAPESNQSCLKKDKTSYPCGQQAKEFLSNLVANKAITCEGKKVDRYNRSLMICFIQEKDINAVMVESGWALAYTQYSRKYVPQERSARENSYGMWAGTFMPPWNWRRR